MKSDVAWTLDINPRDLFGLLRKKRRTGNPHVGFSIFIIKLYIFIWFPFLLNIYYSIINKK